jgi:UDP-N-acetylglucosamine transferase subunit ALG13
LSVEQIHRKPRILVAPLDWGLGHAPRCIPVIKQLIANNAEVIIATEGPHKLLLSREFPEAVLIHLDGYRINYAKTRAGLLGKMFFQIPKILKAIRSENKWLQKVVQDQRIDAVISDNRFGLCHKEIPCIFITHQLLIKSPFGTWSEKKLQKWNYKNINKFSACWIPDNEGDENLAGSLSHPGKRLSVPLRYIGVLSRFQKKEIKEKKNHLLFILSGPEPQRSIFENKIINEISHYNGTAVIVRGLPGSPSLIPSTGMIQFHNHLPAEELNKEIAMAEYIISRSGYTTVMDLVKLKKKSILVPTPGQTEQEYLAGYLMEKGIAVTMNQKLFSLTPALPEAANFNYRFIETEDEKLKVTVKEFVQALG